MWISWGNFPQEFECVVAMSMVIPRLPRSLSNQKVQSQKQGKERERKCMHVYIWIYMTGRQRVSVVQFWRRRSPQCGWRGKQAPIATSPETLRQLKHHFALPFSKLHFIPSTSLLHLALPLSCTFQLWRTRELRRSSRMNVKKRRYSVRRCVRARVCVVRHKS